MDIENRIHIRVIQQIEGIHHNRSSKFQICNTTLTQWDMNYAVGNLTSNPEQWDKFVLFHCKCPENSREGWIGPLRHLLKVNNITHFALYSCKFGLRRFHQIFQALYENGSIRALDLFHNHINGVTGGQYMCIILREMVNLCSLRLSSNPLRDRGIHAMAPGISVCPLRCLLLAHCKITDEGFKVLIHAIIYGAPSRTIKKLDLGANKISGKELSLLIQLLDKTHLKILDLHDNSELLSDPKDVRAFGECLRQNTTLQWLCVSRCGLDRNTTEDLLNDIKRNVTLKKCYLLPELQSSVDAIMERNSILSNVKTLIQRGRKTQGKTIQRERKMQRKTAVRQKKEIAQHKLYGRAIARMSLAELGGTGIYHLLRSPTSEGRMWLEETMKEKPRYEKKKTATDQTCIPAGIDRKR